MSTFLFISELINQEKTFYAACHGVFLDKEKEESPKEQRRRRRKEKGERTKREKDKESLTRKEKIEIHNDVREDLMDLHKGRFHTFKDDRGRKKIYPSDEAIVAFTSSTKGRIQFMDWTEKEVSNG